MFNPLKKDENIKMLEKTNLMSDIKKSEINKFCMVYCSQKCDCGYFKPRNICMNLDICHNCIWADSPYDGSEILYCSKKY